MITRGTTPTMTFGLPFETDVLATGYVTVQQNDVTVIEKPLTACDCDGMTLSAKLTQEETLRLAAGVNAKIRIVAVTGGGDRFESRPIYETVEETSKDGVI